MRISPFCRRSCLVSLVALSGLFASLAHAERPIAPKLLPENTLVFVRVASAPELVEKFKETSIGKIGQNEKIKPLIGQLYGSAAEAFTQIQDQIGVSLDELLALPQGEVCVAIVEREGSQPTLVAILDVGDRIASARKLLERADELASDRGLNKRTETVGEIELTIYEGLPGGNEAVIFERDRTIVITGDQTLSTEILARWDGQADKEDRTLADNRKFLTIMSRCKGTKDERPQITWYADPIKLVEAFAQGPARTALAFLPVLGLDGFLGVGGSFIMAPEDFDGIVHFHVLLDNPRAGVIDMLALSSGDTTPEDWVPPDVNNYMTMHWDVGKTYSKLETLIDSFNTEGMFADIVQQRLSDRIGVDFEKDFIDALDGRFTYITAIVPPVSINGQANLIGAKLKDAKKFRRTLEKVLETTELPLEKKTFAGVKYYQVDVPFGPGRPFRPADGENGPPRPNIPLRQPKPCLAIMGDYLVISDSTELLQRAIKTKNDSKKSLANELDFQLIASKIKRQTGNKKVGMITFNRPKDALQMLYDVATDKETRKSLATGAEDNEFLSVLNKALKDNPLPPFAELAKHLAPGGGLVINDETGFHYMGFTLKRKASGGTSKD
ncbi:MAG: hypothetical protein IH991_09090 [Planctomycetes bacterium]|nr:hypothetical protein [Planctomycetota bacterium]